MTDEKACIRCGRVASDLVHDNPNDHGWTGCDVMHPFVDENGKTLLQWTARNVAMRRRTGPGKSRRLSDEAVQWNKTILRAEAAVNEMFTPISAERLAKHDHYFMAEYAKRGVQQ